MARFGRGPIAGSDAHFGPMARPSLGRTSVSTWDQCFWSTWPLCHTEPLPSRSPITVALGRRNQRAGFEGPEGRPRPQLGTLSTMASAVYDRTANDYRGSSRGVRILVRENDGAIGIEMSREGEDPDSSKSTLSAMLNTSDAEELRDALNEAIDRAKPKRATHPSVKK